MLVRDIELWRSIITHLARRGAMMMAWPDNDGDKAENLYSSHLAKEEVKRRGAT